MIYRRHRGTERLNNLPGTHSQGGERSRATGCRVWALTTGWVAQEPRFLQNSCCVWAQTGTLVPSPCHLGSQGGQRPLLFPILLLTRCPAELKAQELLSPPFYRWGHGGSGRTERDGGQGPPSPLGHSPATPAPGGSFAFLMPHSSVCLSLSPPGCPLPVSLCL